MPAPWCCIRMAAWKARMIRARIVERRGCDQSSLIAWVERQRNPSFIGGQRDGFRKSSTHPTNFPTNSLLLLALQRYRSARLREWICLPIAADLLPKILCPQLDRRAVRRALGRVLPGVAITRQHGAVGHAFGRDEALERVEPVPVVSLAGVGIACSLCALDFLAERCGPFVPCEQATLMQRERHRKRLRLPGLPKHRPLGVARDARHGLGGATGSSRIDHAGSSSR